MTQVDVTPSARTKRLKIWLLVAVIAVYIVTLVPMFAIARYNIPYGDDLLFSSTTAKVYEDTGSIFAALREAGNVVARYYEDWQGTYAGILLMALQPGAFSVQYYALTPFLMIGALTLSSFFFARTVAKKLLRTDRKTYLIITFLILLFSVQFPPSAREAFYWYNGAVYYTFFHCLLLCLISVLILLRQTSYAIGRHSGASICYGMLALLLSFCIAGGNYATALPCGILLALNVLLWVLPCQNVALPRKERTLGMVFACLTLFVFCIGMVISVSAPGNAVRQSSVDLTYQSMPAPVAVAASFPLAFAAVLNRLDIGAVLLIGLLLLFLPPYLTETKFSFRYPGLVVLLAFCVYASQFTPTLYAASSPGPHRLRNLEFFNFYWLLSFATIYICGAILRRRKRENATLCRIDCRERTLLFFARRPLVAVLFAGCLVVAMFFQRDLTKTPVYTATTELISNVAAAHAEKRSYDLLPEEMRPSTEEDGEPPIESQLLS